MMMKKTYQMPISKIQVVITEDPMLIGSISDTTPTNGLGDITFENQGSDDLSFSKGHVWDE